MNFLVNIDRLGNRYGYLPSYLVHNATTFDLYVMDIALRHEIIEKQKREGKYVKPVPKLTQEQMQDMIANVKKQKK